MTTKVLGTLVVAFATSFMPGEALAVTCTVPGSHPTIQAAVNDGSCSTINVAPGTYPENVIIPRSLILNGAQAGNPVALRVSGGPLESTVKGVAISGNVPVFTIAAPGVTIDGFSVTNQTVVLGAAFGIGIKVSGSGALLTNNIIDTVNTPDPGSSGTAQAIYLEAGPDNVRILGNDLKNIHSNRSAKAVLIGDSSSTNPSVNILIQGNSMSNIISDARGAYGVQINNGNGSTANTGLEIRDNTIKTLNGGGWAHAIGLEGNTPGVMVVGNSISAVVDLTPTVFGQDAVAVWFEANPTFPTAKVNQNNFDVTIAAYGIAVQAALLGPVAGGSVDGTCNWWGDPNGPGPVGPGAGAKVSYNVTFTPWLSAPTPVGACIGGESTPGKATGGGQMEGDPVFALEDSVFFPIGTLLSVPALVPSVSNPNERATFGFVAKCCAASGNLQYNDHAADVQIKARSVDGLSISPAPDCPTPGGRHATITGMADVIRSTGTTSEPFTVEVDDCGEPGTADSFGIRTITYTNGPKQLVGGNIQIRE